LYFINHYVKLILAQRRSYNNMNRERLVRDGIPGLLKARGLNPLTHVADDQEFSARLRDKLKEKVGEFLESGESDELADILEVVYTIARETGLSREHLEIMRENKAAERGRFTQRIVLEES
jgi:predicted house-cleaning noncanonical NTP pyrophosphatase (MazG superfamily)